MANSNIRLVGAWGVSLLCVAFAGCAHTQGEAPAAVPVVSDLTKSSDVVISRIPTISRVVVHRKVEVPAGGKIFIRTLREGGISRVWDWDKNYTTAEVLVVEGPGFGRNPATSPPSERSYPGYACVVTASNPKTGTRFSNTFPFLVKPEWGQKILDSSDASSFVFARDFSEDGKPVSSVRIEIRWDAPQ